MEHLLHPKDPVQRIEVPYVVIEDIHAYDGERLTFSQFRQTHHFDEQTIQRQGWDSYACSIPGKGQIDSSRVVESFLQEWLFFGLLYEVLREDFKREDFVQKKEGSPWAITTSKLPGMLWRYKQRWASMNHDLQDQNSQCTMTYLNEASEFVNKFLGSESVRQASITLHGDVVLSVTVMVSTLSAAAAEVCKIVQFSVTRPMRVDELLLKHGWCPTSLAMLERRAFGPLGMYYAAMLGPLASSRDHRACRKDELYCMANIVKRASYQTNHSPDCRLGIVATECNRSFEHIDLAKVFAAINSEGHPVVTVLSDSDSDFGLDVQQSSFHQPYVAISHVWMDGMGNNDGNALPRCQLRRLQRLATSLYNAAETAPVPFWIDTLCVPRWDREYRTKAINKMAATYRDADKILVLDANLFADSRASCQADHTEIFMRIISTNWMRRLWTLQEGVLGKSLYFVFADGVVDIQNSVSSLHKLLEASAGSLSQPENSQVRNLYPGQTISRTALKHYTNLRILAEKQKEDKLALMWNNMQWRSTSWASDETVCMALLLDFSSDDIKAIQDIDVVYVDPDSDPTTKASLEPLQRTQLTARYKRFLQLLSRHKMRIPKGLIFTRGDKFVDKGLRWAPSSFFRTAATGTILSEQPTAEATDEGVLVNAPGFELYLPPTPFTSRFVMLDETTSTFFDVDYATPVLQNKVPWKDLAPENIEDPAIILPEIVANDRIGAMGLLVSVTRRAENILFATYLGHVFVRQFSADLMNWEALTKMNGPARANAMKAGLMGRLWNRRPGVPHSSGPPWVASHETVDEMPERWREDGAALNHELKYMFASSRRLPPEQKWCIG
jgi:hypothetical protein